MKRNLLIIIIVIAVTPTAIFSIRASIDALALVIGMMLGIAASVPTTLLMMYLFTRSRYSLHTAPSQPSAAQPPVVVINTPDKASLANSASLPTLASTAPSRKWTLIGDSETE